MVSFIVRPRALTAIRNMIEVQEKLVTEGVDEAQRNVCLNIFNHETWAMRRAISSETTIAHCILEAQLTSTP